MKKLGIINVATSCLDYAEGNYDLITLYNPITIYDKTYLDYIDIKADEFYNLIANDKNLVPKTAMPSFKDLDDAVKKHIEAGMSEVLVITISSGLSGTYEHIKIFVAAQEYPIKVEVFDSKAASIHEGYLDIVSAEMASEGKTLDDVIPKLNDLVSKGKVYFTVGELRLLVANGRMSNAVAIFGNLAAIKPILTLDKEGKVQAFKKVRTSKKAVEEMVDTIFGEIKGKEVECFTLIITNIPELEDYVYERVVAEYPNVPIYKTYNTPGIGCHVGDKLVGLGYYLK